MQRYRELHGVAETWPVAERLLVAVSSGPNAARLVRAARRLAERLRAEWLVVYVETPAELRVVERGAGPRLADPAPRRDARSGDGDAERRAAGGGDPALRASPQCLEDRRRQADPRALAGLPLRLRARPARARERRHRRLRDRRRSGGGVAGAVPPAAAANRTPAAMPRPSRSRRLATALSVPGAAVPRSHQPGDDLPARRGRHRLPLRARPFRPRLGAERGGVRFLLRARRITPSASRTPNTCSPSR